MEVIWICDLNRHNISANCHSDIVLKYGFVFRSLSQIFKMCSILYSNIPKLVKGKLGVASFCQHTSSMLGQRVKHFLMFHRWIFCWLICAARNFFLTVAIWWKILRFLIAHALRRNSPKQKSNAIYSFQFPFKLPWRVTLKLLLKVKCEREIGHDTLWK